MAIRLVSMHQQFETADYNDGKGTVILRIFPNYAHSLDSRVLEIEIDRKVLPGLIEALSDPPKYLPPE